MNNSEIVMYLGFFLIIAGFIIISISAMEEVKTDCFDRYGSQIEGLECTKNIDSKKWLPLASMLSILFGFMAIITSYGA